MKGVATLKGYSATPSPDPGPAGATVAGFGVETVGTGFETRPPGCVAPAGATVAGITSLLFARGLTSAR